VPDPVVVNRVPAVTVNNRGVVLAAWIDAPGTPGRRCEQSVHVAASVDGGRTFSPGQLVSAVPVCPDSTHIGSSTGGDYFGLVAAPDGVFRLLWSEMRDRIAHLRTVTVTVDGAVVDRK
jgi:hypothetical protein